MRASGWHAVRMLSGLAWLEKACATDCGKLASRSRVCIVEELAFVCELRRVAGKATLVLPRNGLNDYFLIFLMTRLTKITPIHCMLKALR